MQALNEHKVKPQCEFRDCDTGPLNDMLSLTERSEVRDSGTGLLNEREARV